MIPRTTPLLHSVLLSLCTPQLRQHASLHVGKACVVEREQIALHLNFVTFPNRSWDFLMPVTRQHIDFVSVGTTKDHRDVDNEMSGVRFHQSLHRDDTGE